MNEMNPRAALDEAIRRAGGPKQLGKMLGISRPAVAQWRKCPPTRVLQIEALTGVARTALRPDIYPAEPT